MNATVNFKGLKMDVVGNYYPGTRGGLEEQPEPESFEIERVFFDGADIWDLICAFNGEEELENLILDKI